MPLKENTEGTHSYREIRRCIYNPAMFVENYGQGTSKDTIRKQNFRKKLFKQQEGKCHWCTQQMDLNPTKLNIHGNRKCNPAYATFEHLIPKHKGGARDRSNIVLAHASCNNKRHKRKWSHDPVYGKEKNHDKQ